jgi:hypothetical protein
MDLCHLITVQPGGPEMGQGIPRSSGCLRPGGGRSSCPGAPSAEWRGFFGNIAANSGLDPPSSWKIGFQQKTWFGDVCFYLEGGNWSCIYMQRWALKDLRHNNDESLVISNDISTKWILSCDNLWSRCSQHGVTELYKESTLRCVKLEVTPLSVWVRPEWTVSTKWWSNTHGSPVLFVPFNQFTLWGPLYPLPGLRWQVQDRFSVLGDGQQRRTPCEEGPRARASAQILAYLSASIPLQWGEIHKCLLQLYEQDNI